MTPRTITTDAVARREAEPDLATVEVEAVGEGESASEARGVAKVRASTLRESMTDVPTDQISTIELEVRETDRMFDPVTDAPFQATERLHVDCAPETAESVVIDVSNAGGQIRSVQFRLHEDTHRELQNEAISSAMERAREKAEQMAATEGLTVAEVREATTEGADTGFESIVDEALDGNDETELHPAPITVTEGVEVVYELTQE